MDYITTPEFVVLDLETTAKKSFGRTSNCFDKDNWVVAVGYKYNTSHGVCTDYYPVQHKRLFPCCLGYNNLIGFNIKFDLLYLWHDEFCQQWIKDGHTGKDAGKIWDCQLVEYILSGQTHTYPSLDDCALKYGGTLKDDRIKKLWKFGIDTEASISLMLISEYPLLKPDTSLRVLELIGPHTLYDYMRMPLDELLRTARANWKNQLLEYLKHDVLNTETVYLSQLAEVKRLKLEKFIEFQMDALLCTIEMEYNGMYVNQIKAKHNKAVLRHKLEVKEEEIKGVISSTLGELDINIGSNAQVSAVLFGGQIKINTREQVGVFKSGAKIGEPRYKIQKDVVTINGIVKPSPSWETDKPGVYSVNESVLTALTKRKREAAAKDLAILLLEYRGLAKEVNTYYESMVKLVQSDGYIHHSLNHCATATGRLSSTKPNMQNIPKNAGGDNNQFPSVKQIFTSRYDNGVIIELDFKNLEVVAAAFLSQDPVMIQDLVSGADPHVANAAIVFDKDISEVTADERQIAKVASFQLLYGAGQQKIAEVMFDGDEDKATRFIFAYYDRYSRLKLWQGDVAKSIRAGRKISSHRTDRGLPSGESTYRSCTGRLYKFLEYDAPKFLCDKGVAVSFSPTEMKNYPVQGFATADVVLFQLGKLFRVLSKHRDKCLLINTIHDSVLLDCKAGYKDIVIATCKDVLEDVKTTLKELGINFNVPIAVDPKSGASWGDMK